MNGIGAGDKAVFKKYRGVSHKRMYFYFLIKLGLVYNELPWRILPGKDGSNLGGKPFACQKEEELKLAPRRKTMQNRKKPPQEPDSPRVL